MRTHIIERLKRLEAMRLPGNSFVIVAMPDGETASVPAAEWFAHRREWRWLRMGRGFDPAYRDIGLLLSALDEEARA